MVMGNGYETGGSIIHGKNKYAVDLSEKFGFEKKVDSGEAMSIQKGDEYVLNTSKWTLITVLKVLYRYGFNYNRLTKLINGFIDEFSTIYELQEQGKVFQTPEEMLEAMSPNLLNLTKGDTKSLLKSLDFSENFIEELVQAITYVNYGQDLSIHAFVGSVATAGADADLWSVRGGNRELPKSLMAASNAKLHLNTAVTEVVNLKDGTYKLMSNSQPLGIFDHVVLAYPIEGTRSSLKYTDFENTPYISGNKKFHRTVATIVAGHVNPNFKWRADILTCDPTHFYTSISLLHPTILLVAEKYPVYKIFSPKELTKEQLNEIFEEIQHVEVHDWLAYPEYDTIPQKFPSFVLQPRLYYLNAVEWAASAIEMSLISGKNIALMISKEYQ
ncbi:unnamed protein product [Orchesella dallaii]|uniref:Prenylcysteine lyase domain-containing protein n=1 Tax=Orchesella dallaii TaxID=48710 RepID=A0ABP1S1D6_9HEXA